MFFSLTFNAIMVHRSGDLVRAILMMGLIAIPSVGIAQEPLGAGSAIANQSSDTVTPPSETGQIDGGTAKDDPAVIAKALEQLPEEVRTEAEEAYEKFQQTVTDLAVEMGDLREIQVRFVNDLDRSREAKLAFRDQRYAVWDMMQMQFQQALDVFRLLPSQEAASYLVTMCQHHYQNDIYDQATFEASARLLDIGQSFRFLFQVAGRSGAAAGNFETARKIYESLKETDLERPDMLLMAQMDELEEQFQEETERMKAIDRDALPQVKLTTTQGDVLIELYPGEAPSTVAHFLKLVENGFYDGNDFSQVIPNILALTGDTSGDGRGTSGQFLVDEHTNENAHHGLRGSLVMAKIPIGGGEFVENSASSQFAIFFLPVANASSQQTVFGRVIEGMDRISSLRRIDPSKKDDKKLKLPPDAILRAEIVRPGPDLPEPKYVDIAAEFRKAQEAGLIPPSGPAK